jgi:hypothetical protein
VFSTGSIHKACITLALLGGLQASALTMPDAASTPGKSSKTMKTDEVLAKETEVTLESAEKAIEKQDWPAANVLLQQGLTDLGNRYLTADIIDETGMKLMVAEVEEKKGSLSTAAGIRRGVLSSRLSLLRQKIAATPAGTR